MSGIVSMKVYEYMMLIYIDLSKCAS